MTPRGTPIDRLLDYAPLFKLVAVCLVIFFLRQPLLSLAANLALDLGRNLHKFVGVSAISGHGHCLDPHRASFRCGLHYMNDNWDQIAGYFGVHLRLVAEAICLSTLVGVPIGVLVSRLRWLYLPVFLILDTIYTIPSLALFATLIGITGISDTTVIIPMVGYAQFILVRNVIVGLEAVPAEVKEAARGMGMNKLQILLRVEMPLALPVILTGLRIATVASIGIAAVAAFISIQDLGRLFVDATTSGGINAFPMIDAGVVAVTGLAIGADLAIRIIERYIPANRIARAGRPGRIRRFAGSVFPSRAVVEELQPAER